MPRPVRTAANRVIQGLLLVGGAGLLESRRAPTGSPSTWTPLIIGVVYLLAAIVDGPLGDRLDIAGVDYVRFILPGLLVMTVAGQAFANISTSLFQAKSEGYIEDVLSSPMQPSQLLVGYMAGGLLRAWLAAPALWLVALPRPHRPARDLDLDRAGSRHHRLRGHLRPGLRAPATGLAPQAVTAAARAFAPGLAGRRKLALSPPPEPGRMPARASATPEGASRIGAESCG